MPVSRGPSRDSANSAAKKSNSAWILEQYCSVRHRDTGQDGVRPKRRCRGTRNMVLSPPEIRALAHLLARYREPNSARGVFELGITVVPFVVIWALMWTALDHGYGT